MNDGIISVALVRPPIAGHENRGTGSYLNNLYKALLILPRLKVELVNYPENRSGFDLIHYPYFDPFFLTLPIIESKQRIVTVHDLIPLKYPQEFRRGLRGSIKWQIQKTALSFARLILTDSQASKRDIVNIAQVPEVKIKVIPLGVDARFNKISDKEKLIKLKTKFKLPENFILNVGDINYNKNIPNLLTAFQKFQLKYADYKLVLIGEGFVNNSPALGEIEYLIGELKIGKNILKLSKVTPDELTLFYNLARVYVQPSIDEGFGLPVLEAMASGCPVISSQEGSLKEITGRAATQINAFDPVDISEKIRFVVENTNLQKQLAARGIQQSANYSWEKTAEMTFKSYQQVLSSEI